jgi:MEMO1 family protein
VDSVAVASAAVGFDSGGHRLFSYEGPFGVGYLIALLYSSPQVVEKGPAGEVAKDETVTDEAEALIGVARRSIEARLHGERYRPELGASAADEVPPDGVFVTLYSVFPGGEELRGCIGRHGRAHRTVAEEVADLAISSAFDDPRFPPLEEGELPNVRIEISLLGAPEDVPAGAEETLDPARYGVIMTSASSRRQATLLPDIEGVDTVEQQLGILRRKAGIGPKEPVTLKRYTVRKIKE